MDNLGIWVLSILIFFLFQKDLGKEIPHNDKLIIAFGSCNHQDKPQLLWDDIRAEKADLWLWLGDNIYGDSQNPEVLKLKYLKQKQNSDYTELIKETKIEGVWDDHDYGENDAGKFFPLKRESQGLFLDFLDINKDDDRRSRKGTYHSFTMEKGNLQIKFFLLDTRYFRDDPVDNENSNQSNMKGTVLGKKQWRWLEEEMLRSNAEVNIIVSSIQLIPTEHEFEKWQNFPKERTKLMDMIVKTDLNNPLILSGDRHIGEISRIGWKGESIFEITSSSMTHGWKNKVFEANSYRIGNIVYELNYGVLEIVKNNNETMIKAFIKSDNSLILAEENF